MDTHLIHTYYPSKHSKWHHPAMQPSSLNFALDPEKRGHIVFSRIRIFVEVWLRQLRARPMGLIYGPIWAPIWAIWAHIWAHVGPYGPHIGQRCG